MEKMGKKIILLIGLIGCGAILIYGKEPWRKPGLKPQLAQANPKFVFGGERAFRRVQTQETHQQTPYTIITKDSPFASSGVPMTVMTTQPGISMNPSHLTWNQTNIPPPPVIAAPNNPVAPRPDPPAENFNPPEIRGIFFGTDGKNFAILSGDNVQSVVAAGLITQWGRVVAVTANGVELSHNGERIELTYDIASGGSKAVRKKSDVDSDKGGQ